jgi:hypothetical protein
VSIATEGPTFEFERDHPVWRFYYTPRATFGSEEGSVEDVPPWGVQGVAVPHERAGTRLIYNTDFYVWKDGGWFGMDFLGLIDWLVNEVKTVKVGRTGAYSDWEDLLKWMVEDKNCRVLGEPYRPEAHK